MSGNANFPLLMWSLLVSKLEYQSYTSVQKLCHFPFFFFKRGIRLSSFFPETLWKLSLKCEVYNEVIFPSAYQNAINFCFGFYRYNNTHFLHYNLRTMHLKFSKYMGVFQLSCLILGIFPDSLVISSTDLQTSLSFVCNQNINCLSVFLTRVCLIPITSFRCLWKLLKGS